VTGVRQPAPSPLPPRREPEAEDRGPPVRYAEAVLPFALPLVRAAASWAVARSDALDRRLFAWQVGRFVRDAAVRAA
jgi:hypothetical protein